jgi:hypothetical protein
MIAPKLFIHTSEGRYGVRLAALALGVSLGGCLTGALALSACSAGEDADETPDFSVPPFGSGGANNPSPAANVGAGLAPSANPAAAPGGAGGAGSGSGDQNLGNVAPVSGVQPTGGGGGPGAGGMPGVPSGSGGSAMSGGQAGQGMLGSGGSATEPPPVSEPEPPPDEPDPVEEPEPPLEPPPPPPAAPPPNLPGALFFFDDFEGGRDPAWTESHVGGNGTISIDATRGANGSTSSLRVDGAGVFHTMLQLALPAAVRTANQFYARAYVRVDQTPGNGHFVWIEAGTLSNDSQEIRFGSNIGLLQINQFGGPEGGDRDIRDRGRQLVANTWHCVQLFFDGAPEAIQVSLDGTETALSTSNFTAQRPGSEGNTTPLSDWMPPFEAIRFGWELQGNTIWYDDIALGSAPIPCD